MNYNEWLNNDKCCNANWQCSVSLYTADQIDRIVSGITARIDELEQDLQQCCSGGTIYYRWVTKLNDYWCDGTTKMTVEKQQSSTDEINWYDTGEERNGTDVIEYNSPDCGYIPPNYKWIATYIGGYQNFQNCDDSGTIINREINVRNLTNVEIMDCVTTIGESAFSGATSLTAVTLPDTITSIGQRGFYRCSGLTSIDIPSGITSIEYGTFADCSGLTSVTIPSGVTSIGINAFIGCSGLTSIDIPSGVTSIEANAFRNCGGLTSATINAITPPDTPEPYDTFNGTYPIYVPCESVDAYKAHSGWTKYSERITCDSPTPPEPPTPTGRKWLATYSGGTTSSAECDSTSAITSGEITKSGLTSVEIGDCVSAISGSAFYSATTLSAITIPSGVTSIGRDAFYICNSLTDITLPDSVTSIGNYAFGFCTSLSSCTIGSGVTSIGMGAFERCNSLTAITLPDSLTSIGSSAFFSASSLTTINIPTGVTSIGDRAFGFCESLSSAINIPTGVTSIGDGVFNSCYSLSAVTIPSGVTSIGNNAFHYCRSLRSINIPATVTSIGESAFNICSGLTSITVNATTPPTLGNYAFDLTNNCPIRVPDASINAYKSAWSAYASRIRGTSPEIEQPEDEDID